MKDLGSSTSENKHELGDHTHMVLALSCFRMRSREKLHLRHSFKLRYRHHWQNLTLLQEVQMKEKRHQNIVLLPRMKWPGDAFVRNFASYPGKKGSLDMG